MEVELWIEKKLLEKQKKVSKIQAIRKVEIPQEAFIGVLKINKEHEKHTVFDFKWENISNEMFFCDNLDMKSTPEGQINILM